MSNKFILFILSAALMNCLSPVKQQNISSDDVNRVIQEFTEARIGQYLYSEDTPKDNFQILAQILKAHGYSYNTFMKAFKEDNEKVFNKMFPDGAYK